MRKGREEEKRRGEEEWLGREELMHNEDIWIKYIIMKRTNRYRDVS